VEVGHAARRRRGRAVHRRTDHPLTITRRLR
jgi:hypothetical protein